MSGLIAVIILLTSLAAIELIAFVAAYPLMIMAKKKIQW